MQNIIIRNVKKEDLWSVSSIVVEGWKSAYRGIIDDEFLDSLKVEDNYNRRLKDYQENGFIVAEIDNEVVVDGHKKSAIEKALDKLLKVNRRQVKTVEGEIVHGFSFL